MTYPYQFLLPLLSLFWVRVDLTDLYPLKVPVHILNIRDGDTLSVKAGTQILKVRLSRIDAPELHQNFHGSNIDAGLFSRNCLRKISTEKTTLRIEGFDIYHRILGDVGGLNFLAVVNGCSGLYPHAQFSSVKEKFLFVKALMEARKNRRGVWAHQGYMLPKKWRKISKRNGRRRWPPRAHSRVTYRPGQRRG